MSLTEAGALYYDQIVRVLDDLDEADSSLGIMQQRPSGLLRISAPITLTEAHDYTPRRLRRAVVVKITLLIKDHDPDKLQYIVAKRRAVFGSTAPASTLIPVSRLYADGVPFEIDAVAVAPASR